MKSLVLGIVLLGGLSESAPREVEDFISVLKTAEELSFQVHIVETFEGSSLAKASPAEARALSDAVANVAMDRGNVRIEYEVSSNSVVQINSDGKKLTVVSPSGSSSHGLDDRSWWGDLRSLGVDPCIVSSLLETWLGAESWYAKWFEETLKKAVKQNGHLVYYDSQGNLSQLFEIEISGQDASQLSLFVWATINEATINGEDYLVRRTRTYTKISVKHPRANEIKVGLEKKGGEELRD